jgi:hypothetical protein
LSQQLLDLLVALSSARHKQALFGTRDGDLISDPAKIWRWWRGDCLGEAAVVAGDGLLDVFGEVVPQVPAVGDLDRVRGRRCGRPASYGLDPVRIYPLAIYRFRWQRLKDNVV